MKKVIPPVLIMVLLTSGWAVYAGSVTIPNTFTAGTTAIADEVNANFTAIKTAVDDNALSRIVVKANGTELGTFLSYNWDLYFLSSTGYIVEVNMLSGVMDSPNYFYYTTSDCTGIAYTAGVTNGTVFTKPATSDIYYVDKTSVASSITINSSWGEIYGCTSLTGTEAVWVVTANDSSVTGVSTSTFDLPITIERS